MRPTIEPDVGQRVYSFADEEAGQPRLWMANYVHRRGNWRRYRNISTGEEWNENSLRWWMTIGKALGQYIEHKAILITNGPLYPRPITPQAEISRVITAVQIALRETQRQSGSRA